MKRITAKYLNELLAEVGQLSNQPTTEAQAKEMGTDRYLHLEYAACYGGYRIVNVKISNGAHFGAFGGNGCEGRVSASKMAIRLEGIISGMQVIA
jgi:hypothetical protein